LDSSSWIAGDPFGQLSQEITAANSGNFSFTDLDPAGTYDVDLSIIPGGYSVVTANPLEDVSVSAGVTTSVTFGIQFQPAEGWFQVEDGDVGAATGNIESPAPAGKNFMTGQPGVAVYAGSTDFSAGGAPAWQVNERVDLTDFNFSYFANIVSTSTFPCDPSQAACWGSLASGNYLYTGTINLPANVININNKEVVVLVNGDLNINREIRVADSAFLAFIVSGDINIDGGVKKTGVNPALEGVYFADGTLSTGESAEEFMGKGIFVAGGFNLERDLGADNETTPAEVFIFDPGLVVKMPRAMKKSRMSWQEVAP